MKPHNRTSNSKRTIGVLVIIVLFLAGLPVRSASATAPIHQVDKTTGIDSGDCISSPCRTIGYAIVQASDNDTIEISAGIFDERITVNKNLTFTGKGMDTTFLDGGDGGRVVMVNSGKVVAFNDLTIQEGNIADLGGGILNYGTLSLAGVKVRNNTAISGGGISSEGTLTITDSIISANLAYTPSGTGGGLELTGSAAVTLTRVTVRDNTAGYYSGGIHNQMDNSSSGSLTLTNVTISGNTAKYNGALVNTNKAVTDIVNSTIAGNHFSTGGSNGGIGSYGGSISFKNTIISGNDGTNCDDSGGTWISYGNNLDSGNTCVFASPSDLSNTDPLLDALADNGGPTPTMALGATSPAIDAGTNTGCPATDQRGIPRPVGATCDMGAFERGHHIAGVTGLGGVTLAYTDGIAKTATSDGSCKYSFYISQNWSGSVTPSLSGFTFLPDHRDYSGVTSDQLGQNYTALVTISGNAEVGSATLTYVDGTTKHVHSAVDGTYTLSVPYNWSGTVTPTKAGIIFSPVSRAYTNVTTNKTSQNYVAKFTVSYPSYGTKDGWILESARDSGVGGSMDVSATTFRLGDTSLDRQYRVILSFNTAFLPDDAIIQSAILKIDQSGTAVGTNPFTVLGSLKVDINQDPFGAYALELSDFNATADYARVASFSATPVGTWYSATLPANGRININKTGITQFRLYFSTNSNNNGVAEYMKFISGDYVTATYRPQLVIIYTLP